ncbi:unnamed protein product [Sphagnum troendelagicum]|uniref:Maturase K n=1 Tax=Sphagnum troendelagicum TaxID=128251 RepID=A0ABP0TXN4_9BRYO
MESASQSITTENSIPPYLLHHDFYWLTYFEACLQDDHFFQGYMRNTFKDHRGWKAICFLNIEILQLLQVDMGDIWNKASFPKMHKNNHDFEERPQHTFCREMDLIILLFG